MVKEKEGREEGREEGEIIIRKKKEKKTRQNRIEKEKRLKREVGHRNE